MSMYHLVESTDADVNSKDKLARVPEKFLSDDPKRPLLHVDVDGTQYKYALNPLVYCVFFILIIELLERFSYYGINYTQLEYLVGEYNPDWNPNMTTVEAASFVSASSAIAYLSPFIGGILADGLFGDYWNILVGVTCLYLPGLILIALCSYPHVLGADFNVTALRIGMLILWPLGAGFIKSVVNVFGAKQYHPLLQRDLIENYYINFYNVINVGALLGALVPLVAQKDVAVAYTIPAVALGVGLMIFLIGSRRYVRAKPDKKALWTSLRILASPLFCKSIDSNKESNGGEIQDSLVDGLKNLLMVIPATCLILPFSIVYNQKATVFVVQGNAMENAGFVDPSMMGIFDCLSVLFNGAVYQYIILPALKKRDIHLKTTTKFAIGTALCALAILSAIIVDYKIHASSEKISILWQIFSFFFMGAGEILTIALSYDIAFTIAPKQQKGLASGLNLFVFGSLSNFIGIGLYNSCSAWFPVDTTDASEYADSQVYKYLWVLFGITVSGIIFNLLPPVSNWLERISNKAVELNADQGDSEKLPSSIISESCTVHTSLL